jgi:UDP-N-acetylglucosamine transferase subunit ALG13
MTNAKIIVSLGTDFHRFDRLVDWIDDWLDSLESPPSCIVQHGASRIPRVAQGIDRMPRQDLLNLYRQADLVVVQGGPGSILDARETGHIPVAVPRRPELGEVVDAHQLAFTRVMHRQGEAVMATSLEQLIEAGTAVLQDPAGSRTAPRQPGGAAATARLEHVFAELGSARRQGMMLRRARHAWLRQ